MAAGLAVVAAVALVLEICRSDEKSSARGWLLPRISWGSRSPRDRKYETCCGRVIRTRAAPRAHGRRGRWPISPSRKGGDPQLSVAATLKSRGRPIHTKSRLAGSSDRRNGLALGSSGCMARGVWNQSVSCPHFSRQPR
jgi:hypothetical protein